MYVITDKHGMRYLGMHGAWAIFETPGMFAAISPIRYRSSDEAQKAIDNLYSIGYYGLTVKTEN